MKKQRKTIVYEIEDFICKCGSSTLEKLQIPNNSSHGYFKKIKESSPAKEIFKLKCTSCGREYLVKKQVKKMRISNLPMSFGFRSMYWEEINVGPDGLSGKLEEYFEIEEINFNK